MTIRSAPGYIVHMGKVRGELVKDGDFGTIISEEAEVSGTFAFTMPLQILGKVAGDINNQALVVVEESGKVEANIKAPMVIIRGTVKGDVIATKKVELSSKSKVVGYIAAPEVFMEPGSFFEGRCSMA